MKCLLYQLDALTRKSMARLIERNSAHSVSINDIAETLAMLNSQRVDVIFVDIQGDGLDLIRAIRKQENGTRSCTVVALAVGNTKDTPPKCLAAGADEFVAIPVSEEKVEEIVSRVAARSQNSSGAEATRKELARPALDVANALERVEGDRELLEELLQLFADECQSSLEQMRTVWNARDNTTLVRLAHTMKGSAANVGANGISEAARELEMQVRSGNLEPAFKQIANLEREVARLKPELEAFLQQAAH
jgi:two-component system, sensor histidine kinase and response regulator